VRLGGSCSAGGYYRVNSNDEYQGFVVSERNGRWGKAIEVPGTAALNKGFAFLNSVSCAAPGNCGAGGYYTDRHGHQQGFVVSQT
jgi:hypothetical protein